MGSKLTAALAAMALAIAAGGCGFGAGEASEGEVTMRVTEDFGERLILDAALESPKETDTVIGFLDEVADIETSYGGNFVEAIEGRHGSTSGGGEMDWLYFVNGMWAEIGGGERPLHPGERIWWDYRRWQEAERIPIVVGSWPEPFKSGYEGERAPVVLHCRAEPATCSAAEAKIDGQGIEHVVAGPDEPLEDPDRMRILVGAWADLRTDEAVRQLEGGPRESGVYASMLACGDDADLIVRGDDAEPRERLADAGLIAGLRVGTEQPTLLLTGTDERRVEDAISLLEPDALIDRYALAGVEGEAHPVPAPASLPTLEEGQLGCR